MWKEIRIEGTPLHQRRKALNKEIGGSEQKLRSFFQRTVLSMKSPRLVQSWEVPFTFKTKVGGDELHSKRSQ